MSANHFTPKGRLEFMQEMEDGKRVPFGRFPAMFPAPSTITIRRDAPAPAPDLLEHAVSILTVAGERPRREEITWRGMPLFTSELITDDVEDWSACRSPSRARRRRRMGHRQRVRIISVPSSKAVRVDGPPAFFIMHPETLHRFRELLDANITKAMLVNT